MSAISIFGSEFVISALAGLPRVEDYPDSLFAHR